MESVTKLNSEKPELTHSKFIRVQLGNGVVDKAAGDNCVCCLEYSSDGEAYFNKSHVLSFNIDMNTSTISIIFALLDEGYPYRAELVFESQAGEFQRIRRELTE